MEQLDSTPLRRRPTIEPMRRDLGEPGQYMLINKHKLQVDKDYQRDKQKLLINKIANTWDWECCGVLLVAKRRNGTYVILDGQQRWNAALRLDQITDLPCIVILSAGLDHEAAVFLCVNSARKNVSAVVRYRAGKHAGDLLIVGVDRILSNLGFEVKHDGKTASAIGFPEILIEYYKKDKSAFTRTMTLIRELYQLSSPWGEVVRGLLWIEQHLSDGQSLATDPWRRAVLSVGAGMLKHAVKEKGGSVGGGGRGPRHGLLMLEAINTKLSKKKLCVEIRT